MIKEVNLPGKESVGTLRSDDDDDDNEKVEKKISKFTQQNNFAGAETHSFAYI